MKPELNIPEVGPVQKIIDIKNQEIAEILERESKKKSPYTKWTQLNNDKEAQAARYWLMKKSTVAYCVMDFLASKMDNYNAVICSYKVLQEVFGYSRATLAEAIKLLKDHKYIEIVRTGGSNIYMLNKRLYWNSWGTNYAYAEFGAKIIISASEQEKEFQEEIQLEMKKRQEVIIKEEQKAS